MSFQSISGFEEEDRFAEFMVNPKVKGYHRHLDLQTTTIQYNQRNNLSIQSAQLTHDQQCTAFALEASIYETSKHNKNLTAAYRDLLQCNLCIGVDNTVKPLRYHRDDSVVVFRYSNKSTQH